MLIVNQEILVETIYNKLIIITAPSGAGKTSIIKYLLNKYPQLSFSVSATTRTQRKDEENGLDYYFISTDDFKQKIQHNEFVEWEMVYQGKYYGTLKTELHRIWNNNQVPVLDIDVKGAIHVQQKLVFNCLSVFIEPPSIEILRKRLEARGTETSETLQDRINKASYEISFKDNFDNVIVNDDLDKACRETEFIVQKFLADD
ncbi:MAG TPA: guanylate kinase [Puia sp.]